MFNDAVSESLAAPHVGGGGPPLYSPLHPPPPEVGAVVPAGGCDGVLVLVLFCFLPCKVSSELTEVAAPRFCCARVEEEEEEEERKV